MSLQIDVINKSTALTDEQVTRMCTAVQLQAQRDFAPIYATDPDVLIALATVQTPGHWVVLIMDNSDVQGAAGYHEITDTDQPIGKIFAAEDVKYGLNPSVTFSHEVLEMLGDPFAALTYQVDASTFGAWEVCDPVEADALGYDIILMDNTPQRVSDFVLPAWFVGGPGPFSFKSNVGAAGALATGGYVSRWSQATGWTQQVAQREGVTSRSQTMGRSKDRALRAYLAALAPVVDVVRPTQEVTA